MKTCSKCKETKPLSEFYKHKKTKDGLSCWCKYCLKSYLKEYNKEYQKSEKYKEYLKSDKYKEYQKEYYKEHLKKYRKSDNHRKAEIKTYFKKAHGIELPTEIIETKLIINKIKKLKV
jgi:hypothetical protein